MSPAAQCSRRKRRNHIASIEKAQCAGRVYLHISANPTPHRIGSLGGSIIKTTNKSYAPIDWIDVGRTYTRAPCLRARLTIQFLHFTRGDGDASDHGVTRYGGVVFARIKGQPLIVGRKVIVVVEIVILRGKRKLALGTGVRVRGKR